MFTGLLAEAEFPPQAVLFLIVLVFSFLKWLFGKLISKKEGAEPGVLESLYDQYREDIIQRQTQVTPPSRRPVSSNSTSIAATPPILPQANAVPEHKFSSVDIEKARIAKIKRSQQTVTHSGIQNKARSNSYKTPLRKKLRSKDGLRKAIIARQVLGPPKGLPDHNF
jgi:hypothetical protein